PLVAAAPGCHDSEAPIKGRNDSFERPWLTLGSTGLRADTLIQDARPTRDANGILTVAVPVRNVTDLALHVEYRYFFYDDKGMQVNAYPGRVTIPPRQTREVVGNASGPQAKDFRLELSYPRVN
ncbi:MAG TPA: YcfL family protein, partial [Humisphaera sp.]